MNNNNFIIKARNQTFEGFEKEKEFRWNGPFFFIQAADIQLGMIEGYLQKKDDPKWDMEIELTKKSIRAINKMNPLPRFFVVCGDHIDAMPGTKYRSLQEKDFLNLFTELNSDIPLVCVCGNHDVGNTPTPSTIQDYRDKFGDDYFSFFCGGVMFIVINSQFFEDPSLVEDLAKEHEIWLDKQLDEAKTGQYKHAVVFQHIPWFLRTPDEENEYFNIDINLRQKMLKKFYDANIRAVFCGHYHRNTGGFYRELEMVVTSAIGAQLGNDLSGFRIVKVLEHSIKHDYYALDDVPEIISLES